MPDPRIRLPANWGCSICLQVDHFADWLGRLLLAALQDEIDRVLRCSIFLDTLGVGFDLENYGRIFSHHFIVSVTSSGASWCAQCPTFGIVTRV